MRGPRQGKKKPKGKEGFGLSWQNPAQVVRRPGPSVRRKDQDAGSWDEVSQPGTEGEQLGLHT